MGHGLLTKGGLLIVLPFMFAQPAFAYIDPGTGSILLQSLLAGVAGLVVISKLYWYRIKKFFSPKLSNDMPQEPEAAEETSTKNSD